MAERYMEKHRACIVRRREGNVDGCRLSDTADRQAIHHDIASGTKATVDSSARRRRGSCCRHVGSARPVAGVVICPALQAEFVSNSRREVLLSRELAAAGFAVQRFHYRGTGNSQGDPAEVSIATMQCDATRAASWLSERERCKRIAFLGARWGSLVAASMASSVEGAPLVLWDPITDSGSYFREVFRAERFAALQAGTSDSQPLEATIRQLRLAGMVDVLGTRSIARSSRASRIGESTTNSGAIRGRCWLWRSHRRVDWATRMAYLGSD